MRKFRAFLLLRYRIVILILAIFLACAGAIWFWVPQPRTVALGEKGFEPAELRVPVGTVITFENHTQKTFWPASNFHPSHKIYPEFDSKKPIPAGDSWSFRFSVAGVWRYHDHLNSRHTGTIIVYASPFVRAQQLCDGDIDVLPTKTQERCWIQDIEKTLVTKGIDAAFEQFGRLYETKNAFSADCHDVTHLLGEAAYRDYVRHGTVIESTKTAYCGYGFYHGFIEALLFTTGDFQQAKSYCHAVQEKLEEKIVSPNAIYSCYHGLGHGTFDTQAYSEWGDDEQMLASALDTCDRVTRGEEQELVKQCATGVFNALANAYNNNTYNLSFDRQAPWGVCDNQKNDEHKKACFREVTASYIKGTVKDTKEGLTKLSQIVDPVGAGAAMFAYMSEEARLGMDVIAASEFVRLCNTLQSSLLRAACAQGVGAGLFLWGKPGHEHEKAIAFCMTQGLGVESRDACMTYIVPRIRTVYNRDRVSAVCRAIDPAYQHLCQ